MRMNAAAAGALSTVMAAGTVRAQQADPFIWLEDVESPRALEWVEAKNAATVAQLTRHPAYEPIFERTKEILDSDDRIPFPSILGNRLYNFWQDEENPRGVWRRTTWESYLSGEPDWETVLDIDALARAEDVPWAYGGASCLPPAFDRCLVRLSRGGADAVEVREFDARTRTFVEDGFRLPEAKQSVAWIDENTLLVATDYGPGTMSSSGYPRVAKVWRRGTALSSAAIAFEAGPEDMGIFVGAGRTATRRYQTVSHRVDFYNGALHVLDGGQLVKIDVPADADPSFFRDQLIVYLRSPWEVGGRTWEGGTLLSIDYDAFRSGSRDFAVVVDPGPRETIEGASTTEDYVLVSMLNNVRGELRRYRYVDGAWTYETVPAPEMGSIGVAATSPESNRYFFTYSGYTQPATLYLADTDGRVREVRRMPAMFDAAGLVVEQHEAASKDGTRIPYFIVHREGMAHDGNNPTLLYGYGGYQVSLLPNYPATIGKLWLEDGGVYVVANTRGGGEFGPSWHQAALGANRQRAHEDFIAVAQDLISRGITSPRRLGIMGGSQGGLFMGVAMTQHPELFNAAVIQVPLFDMLRFHKLPPGASWMAEYGNPDIPEQRAWIEKYSPYQAIKPGQKYPEAFIHTSTKDDRVHPGHARKAVARLEELGYPVLFYENTDGGHSAAANLKETAKRLALEYTYLTRKLKDEGVAPVN
ncbi:MAG TPA: prolyl oligopeptidase family serine peptidase [Longimicrobiales bacterium]